MNRQFISFVLIVFIEMTRSTSYQCDKSSTCGCSIIKPTTLIESRIIGGEKVKNRPWGWIVSLQMNRKHQCGATLLTDQFAITAAHCFSNQDNSSNYSILAGTNNLNDETNSIAQRRTIQEIYRHQQFNGKSYSHDIAIIRFAPLSTSPNSTLSFICLPRFGEDPFQVNSNLVTIGWGIKKLTDPHYSNSLQQVTVQVIAPDSKQCRQTQLTDQTQHFCAGVSNGGKDTCRGDSGGPIMSFLENRWVLAGITSSGVSCALSEYPGLYTRVSSFIPFIHSIVDIQQITVAKPVIQPMTLSVISNTGSSSVRSISIFVLFVFCVCIFHRIVQ